MFFKEKAAIVNAELIFASDSAQNLKSDLLGDYQLKNIQTAVAAIHNLKGFAVSAAQIEKGLLNVVKNTDLKGRWQILQEAPKVICDTAHNKEGLQITMHQLKKEKYKNLHIVLGVVSDKKLDDVLPIFPKKCKLLFLQTEHSAWTLSN